MKLSEQTATLVQHVASHAHAELSCKNELGMLLELAHQSSRQQILEALTFQAKFAHNTFGIMKRIGSAGEGYDRLSKEFGESIEKIRNYLEQLLTTAPDNEREKFTSRFLVRSPAGFNNLLEILHDLSRYKNYLIDSRPR